MPDNPVPPIINLAPLVPQQPVIPNSTPPIQPTPTTQVTEQRKPNLMEGIAIKNNGLSETQRNRQSTKQSFETEMMPLESETQEAEKEYLAAKQRVFDIKKRETESLDKISHQEHKFLQDGITMVMSSLSSLKNALEEKTKTFPSTPPTSTNQQSQFAGVYLNKQALLEKNQQTNYSNKPTQILVGEIIEHVCGSEGDTQTQAIAIESQSINSDFDQETNGHTITLELGRANSEVALTFLLKHDLSKSPEEQILVSVWNDKEKGRSPAKISQFEKRFSILPKQDQITVIALFIESIQEEVTGTGYYSYNQTTKSSQ